MDNYALIDRVAKERVSTMLSEFAQTPSQTIPYDPSLSLKDSLGVESLALVSMLLRMGEEFERDITEFVTELQSIVSVGDLYFLAQKLKNCQSV